MNELEDFHMDLYHAKFEFISIKAGYKDPPWDIITQRNIDAFSGLCQPGNEIEAPILAAKTYFRDKISYPEIIEIVKACCKSQLNKNDFTFTFFNRLNILAGK